MLLKPFDPWKGRLCTCPPKLSLNPYTGCSHGCLYCYAASYIPRFKECRPKVDLLKRLGREVHRLKDDHLVALSNSSDPYPPLEKDLGLTRECLRILGSRGIPVQVVTKSDLVHRDQDLLREMRATVSLTLTTLEDSLSAILEPGAPQPGRRLEALQGLSRAGVPTSVRVDPIIPLVNEGEIESLVQAAARAGARHVVSSTYKARPDNWKRLSRAFPGETEEMRPLYFVRGEMIGGSRYLPQGERVRLLSRARAAALGSDLTFSTCREGILTDAPSCDGTHLVRLKR
ncbi:MAG: radical SAM protein [Methanosarcinales archaeon]|nr:radical SAM protein [Methanosarcinales archaeon]